MTVQNAVKSVVFVLFVYQHVVLVLHDVEVAGASLADPQILEPRCLFCFLHRL